jgi:hypothetical protein
MADEDRMQHARANARGWYESIQEMLDGLKDYQGAAEDAGWTGPHKDEFGATFYRDKTDGQTWCAASWKELCEAFDIEPDDREEGRREIEESVLSVEVRDGWRTPGDTGADGAEEYRILLTTGGPALRIFGTLGAHGEPESAELQMQDWGTPWTRYADADEDTLLQFARHFYFGE